MTDSTIPTVLIVPGLRDHVEEHWQTLLQRALPNARTVAPLEHDKLSRAARVDALDAAMRQIDGPVVLVAHSAGVMITVHWAQQHRRPVMGALLAAPADLETPLPAGYPTQDALRDNGWLPIPRARLPFPSIVAASTNDPLGRFERVAEMAQAWGSRLVDVGAVGHLNPASGYGEWPRAAGFVAELSRQPAHTADC
ncbi:alpha/beta hydrolase [Burkholderia sp. Ac-20365]|uniref:RBBP9/YdeN family alpha/beta hydrolase n=1 Tax=Burkholderia sp. Ac-20365 TaxID=2703897 RepID=UPI00197B8B8F|nr:alpha/beta hydrolase [Burkholderia sp. Ac-20365]MBN3762120.1 alpha/beta hydrolase [Burkholderia sp. Ac-20365]